MPFPPPGGDAEGGAAHVLLFGHALLKLLEAGAKNRAEHAIAGVCLSSFANEEAKAVAGRARAGC